MRRLNTRLAAVWRALSHGPALPALMAVAALISTPAGAADGDGAATPLHDADVSYAAIRHVETGARTLDMREFRAPGRLRLEMPTADGGGSIMIGRLDRGIVWMLMPSIGSYMEIPEEKIAAAAGADAALLDRAVVLEREEEGSETVHGHETTRYGIVLRDAAGERSTGHYWLTREGIPIRLDLVYEGSGGRVLVELRELDIGPQDDSLFEVPEGYRAVGAAR